MGPCMYIKKGYANNPQERTHPKSNGSLIGTGRKSTARREYTNHMGKNNIRTALITVRGVFERLRKTNEFPAEHSALASAQAQGRRDKKPIRIPYPCSS